MSDFFAGSDEDAMRIADAAVDVRDCWEQPGLELPFHCGRALQPFLEACLKAEREHPGCGLHVVYHWTRRDSLSGIGRTGLLVADGHSVRVKHGRKFGNGVYASRDFTFGKGRYGTVCLLCIGLPGAIEGRSGSSSGISSSAGPCESGSLSSLEPDGESQIVYRNASQVLPCAVVAENHLGCARRAASATMALLYHRFPRLEATPTLLQTPLPPPKRLRVERAMAEKVDGLDNCSPAFAEVLAASEQFRAGLGGAPSFPGGKVSLAGKKTRDQLQAHTAFEHMQLSVLGLAKLEQVLPEVQRLNNGKFFMDNPGTQYLERECGFTMHADRPGSAAVLRDAPALLLRTFEVAKHAGQVSAFFSCTFDRTSGPCLEGRTSLLVEFMQEHSPAMCDTRGQAQSG